MHTALNGEYGTLRESNKGSNVAGTTQARYTASPFNGVRTVGVRLIVRLTLTTNRSNRRELQLDYTAPSHPNSVGR